MTVIDDDLGRSGSGTVERPGFELLVAMVCSGDIGAVYWHLIDVVWIFLWPIFYLTPGTF